MRVLSPPRPRVLATGLVLGLLAAACGDGDATADSAAPTIVATTSIWADVVANVACGATATVETLVPIGADPHAFEPSLADRGRLDDAELVVANGLGLEEGLDDTIEAAAEAGTPVLRVGDHVRTIAYAGDDDHDEHGEGDDHEAGEDDHEHGRGVDPHVWFDPARVREVLPVLADRLVIDVGLDADEVDACVDAYDEQLAALDAEIAASTAAVPDERRRLVTSHESLGYFADRYGFELIGTVIPAPSGLAETNPAQLEALAQLIERTGVPAVFAEAQHSTDDVEALAARVGDIDVVTLFTGSLGADGSGASTYLDFLRTNVALVTDALG